MIYRRVLFVYFSVFIWAMKRSTSTVKSQRKFTKTADGTSRRPSSPSSEPPKNLSNNSSESESGSETEFMISLKKLIESGGDTVATSVTQMMKKDLGVEGCFCGKELEYYLPNEKNEYGYFFCDACMLFCKVENVETWVWHPLTQNKCRCGLFLRTTKNGYFMCPKRQKEDDKWVNGCGFFTKHLMDTKWCKCDKPCWWSDKYPKKRYYYCRDCGFREVEKR